MDQKTVALIFTLGGGGVLTVYMYLHTLVNLFHMMMEKIEEREQSEALLGEQWWLVD